MTNKPRTTIRIVPFFGIIRLHAELLVTIADATGHEVRENFNGDDLVATPGSSPADVVRQYNAVLQARRDSEAG